MHNKKRFLDESCLLMFSQNEKIYPFIGSKSVLFCQFHCLLPLTNRQKKNKIPFRRRVKFCKIGVKLKKFSFRKSFLKKKSNGAQTLLYESDKECFLSLILFVTDFFVLLVCLVCSIFSTLSISFYKKVPHTVAKNWINLYNILFEKLNCFFDSTLEFLTVSDRFLFSWGLKAKIG